MIHPLIAFSASDQSPIPFLGICDSNFSWSFVLNLDIFCATLAGHLYTEIIITSEHNLILNVIVSTVKVKKKNLKSKNIRAIIKGRLSKTSKSQHNQ
jgi:hypothetical protein